jgi:uncharacterized protein YkwD
MALFLVSPSSFSQEKGAEDPSGLPDLKNEIVREINQLRKDPKEYIVYLEELKKYYSGKDLKRPGKVIITTKEGVSALEQAIDYLKKVKPVQALKLSEGMSLAAQDHIMNIINTGITGHKGADGSMPGDRLNRRGKWENAVGENICYGFDTAREIVLWLLIDDGVDDRGHRLNFFRPEYNFIGVHACSHPVYFTICVITFAGQYSEQAGGRLPSGS